MNQLHVYFEKVVGSNQNYHFFNHFFLLDHCPYKFMVKGGMSNLTQYLGVSIQPQNQLSISTILLVPSQGTTAPIVMKIKQSVYSTIEQTDPNDLR